MHVDHNETRRELTFYVELDEDRTLECLQFAHLIAMKFMGTVEEDRFTLKDDGRERLGSMVVSFRKMRKYMDAKDWCRTQTHDGYVRASYVGALDYADRNAHLAGFYLQAIEGAG